MAGLHIFGISNESTETSKSNSIFNDELRWLWNSVYLLVKKYEDDKTYCSLYEGGSESSVIGIITLLINMIGCCIIP